MPDVMNAAHPASKTAASSLSSGERLGDRLQSLVPHVGLTTKVLEAAGLLDPVLKAPFLTETDRVQDRLKALFPGSGLTARLSEAAGLTVNDVTRAVMQSNGIFEGDDRLLALAQLSTSVGRSLESILSPPLAAKISEAAAALTQSWRLPIATATSLSAAEELFRSGALFTLLDSGVRSSLDILQNQSGSLTDKAQDTIRNIDQIWRVFEEADRLLSERGPELAEFGWTLPFQMPTALMLQVLAEADQARIDAAFLEFYSADEGEALAELRRSILESVSLEQWRPLLEQCFEAYEDGRFLICIPSLMSTLEGAVTLNHPTHLKANNRDKFFADKVAACLPGSTAAAAWNSVNVFVSRLFKNAPFNEARPAVLNRHWILHGKDSVPNWKEADALRLFQAIDTVCNTIQTSPVPIEGMN